MLKSNKLIIFFNFSTLSDGPCFLSLSEHPGYSVMMGISSEIMRLLLSVRSSQT